MRFGILALMLMITSSYAEVFKCESGNKVIFTDRPCAGQLQDVRLSETELKKLIKDPYQYIGEANYKVARIFKTKTNDVGSIVIEREGIDILFESADERTVSYIEITLKKTGPCSWKKSFDSLPYLRLSGIESSTLTLIKELTHDHIYLDESGDFKVSTVCEYEGGPYFVTVKAYR